MSGPSRAAKRAIADRRATISAFLDRAREIAGARPRIYVTAQFDLRREVIDNNIAWLAHELAEGSCRRRDRSGDLDDKIAALYDRAEIVVARDLYHDIAEWDRRWAGERTNYSGAILMTAGEPPELPVEPDWDCLPFRGGHDVPLAVAIELGAFVAMRRPVLWLAREVPGIGPHVISRFAIESVWPGGRCDPALAARLYSAIDADEFQPVGSGLPPWHDPQKPPMRSSLAAVHAKPALDPDPETAPRGGDMGA